MGVKDDVRERNASSVERLAAAECLVAVTKYGDLLQYLADNKMAGKKQVQELAENFNHGTQYMANVDHAYEIISRCITMLSQTLDSTADKQITDDLKAVSNVLRLAKKKLL